ncbi:hypothetical protein F0562_001712 [Nyssa sinensis]|uniref:Uncharacterized protein n=1 Tax=Nyssa sinensis TaxID=561372 RepID=A0A5J5C428_9ASTE|nr:hypothetical protein F0562_001712 [Nyssa sinensis]
MIENSCSLVPIGVAEGWAMSLSEQRVSDAIRILCWPCAKRIAESATELADLKVFMEAMMSEMWRVMKLEQEQVHEQIDQMESAHEKLQNAPNVGRRERVQPREVRVEDEEPYGTGFDEEDDQDFVVGNKKQ